MPDTTGRPAGANPTRFEDPGLAGELSESLARFVAWLDRHGPASHDPYDLWGTRYGLWARRLYYARGLLGAPFIAPLLACDFLAPGIRRWFVRPQRYATADAQLILARLNLAQVTGDRRHLASAEQLAVEMLAYSIPGYRGLCWGYPFDWQNNKGMWPRNTPYITCTPYCFEAFLALHDATGEAVHLERAASVAEFVFHNLKDTPTGPDAAAGSYSPFDDSKVVNASAYRAYVMFEAAARFEREDYRLKAERNLRFILQSQREDGSWLYAEGYRADAFIDHFHTCFVLKNLFKLNQRLGRAEVASAIHRGFGYYQRHLFKANGDPRSFSVEPRFQLARLEMYNFAEAITLGTLLAADEPSGLPMARHLARRMMRQFQVRGGWFVTREFIGGLRHTFPFIRWPQAQISLALTNLLRRVSVCRSGSSGGVTVGRCDSQAV